jgi:pimeloyl-ACP methyl ester carboxylesterase
MQRPMMDPTFVKDLVNSKRKRPAYLKLVGKAAKWFGRSLVSNPLVVRRPDEQEKRVSLVKLGLRMAVSWVIFVPLLAGLATALLVFVGTHPQTPMVVADPASQGVYYEPVTFASEDSIILNGWLVPAIDAKRVLEDRDRMLRMRRPAVVLVHDFGQSPQQMLPLVRPLHDEGIVLLLVGLRGIGGDSRAGQTFGLNESKDVAAAVEMLRNRAFVDPARIAVVGFGSGANATLIAASKDSSIKAIVLANPIKATEEEIARRIAPNRHGLRWVEPLFRRVFEVMYNVDTREMNYDSFASVLSSRPTLVFDGDNFILQDKGTTEQVRAFCRRHLRTQDAPPILGTAR